MDTLYSEATLDGVLNLYEWTGSVVVFTGLGPNDVGDGISAIGESPSYSRGYVSFDLAILSQGRSYDSAILEVFQTGCIGNGNFGWYPKWDVPGGDTMFCIADHIDYGSTLDSTDWTAGDVGDPQTVATDIGVLSRDSVVGFKSLDVTSSLINCLGLKNSRLQFRLRFPILTDHDGLDDRIGFAGGDYPLSVAPRLKVISSPTGVDNLEIQLLDHTLFQNYPNPFNSSTTIRYSLQRREHISIELVDVLGRVLQNPVSAVEGPGIHTVSIDASRHSSGMYFVIIRTDSFQQIIKSMLVR